MGSQTAHEVAAFLILDQTRSEIHTRKTHTIENTQNPTFSYKLKSAPSVVSLDRVHAHLAANKALVLPKSDPDEVPLAEYIVQVTNTGSIDADDVVLGFLKPPGAGVGGTPLQTLFGFERVHVPAGKTVEVYLGSTMGDFTQVDAEGKHQVVAGEYTVQFGVQETAPHGMGFLTTTVTAA